jgi:hypothetical protein
MAKYRFSEIGWSGVYILALLLLEVVILGNDFPLYTSIYSPVKYG